MATLAEHIPDPLNQPPLREMFEARKRVFVDLLKWNVPVLENRYEVDQFDDAHAAYLIVPGDGGSHAGSARLLPTLRPHILDTLFPELCASPPPRGADTLEITRGSHASAPSPGATFRIESAQTSARALVLRNFEGDCGTLRVWCRLALYVDKWTGPEGSAPKGQSRWRNVSRDHLSPRSSSRPSRASRRPTISRS